MGSSGRSGKLANALLSRCLYGNIPRPCRQRAGRLVDKPSGAHRASQPTHRKADRDQSIRSAASNSKLRPHPKNRRLKPNMTVPVPNTPSMQLFTQRLILTAASQAMAAREFAFLTDDNA